MLNRFGDRRDWFFEKRFGLFVHWGLYAIPAWHEQAQWRRRIPRREYEKLAAQFNPVRYDPDAWLDLAEEAGMEYVCFTTKHHDGFCLWDADGTDYNVMNSPYGKDILAMLAEACHRRGVPLCLYYSAADWHHPNYPNQGRSHELAGPETGDEPDMERYLDFMVGQVRELCTRYGEIHGFWWDMNVTGLVDRSINDTVRSLQPSAVINNRGFDEGDFGTPERDMDGSVDEVAVFDRLTEACQSVGRESWGYKEDEDYYSVSHLIRSLDKVLAKGGNYLLNVGPKADGMIPEEAADIVGAVGHWYKKVEESFDGTTAASHLVADPNVLLTSRGDTVYVHLTDDPVTDRVLLKPIDTLPRTAVLLNTGQELEARVDLLPTEVMDRGGQLVQPRNYLRIRGLPVSGTGNEVLVVKLEFDEPLE